MVDVSDETIELPPGFRFHPTDEELIVNYLTEKVVDGGFTSRAIGEVDLNKCEPWELPKKARMGEKEWYFFCQRDRKYPTGMRTNRATEAGYWKATGKDKEIYKARNCLVGMKKTLVFYRGRAPKGEKSNWVMHEYRLEGKFSYHNLPRTAKDEWVVCRVFHKSTGVKKTPMVAGLLGANSFGEDCFDSSSLPPLSNSPPYNRPSSSSFINNNNNGGNQNQYSFSANMDEFTNHQNHNKNFIVSNNHTIPPSTNYYSHMQFQNPIFGFPNTSSGNADQAIFRSMGTNNASYDSTGQCKVEQFSTNQSILSQDTGLSTDMNTEISSVASRGNRPYEDFEGPSSSSAQVTDLESLWDY